MARTKPWTSPAQVTRSCRLYSGACLRGISLEAAHIANIAGGLVVMKRRTATISRAELLDAIRAEASGAAY